MYKDKYHKYKDKYTLLKNIANQSRNISMIMTYPNRLNYYTELHNKIREKKDCMSNNTVIGIGGYSKIYKKIILAKENIYEVSIKEQKVNDYILKHQNDTKIKVWNEYNILKKCAILFKNKITQNVPLIYDIELCKNKVLFYSELASGDFLSWCTEHHSIDEWMSFLFQFWSGLYAMQKHMMFIHNDLRLGNILYHKIPKTNEYWKYVIDGVEYYIPNTGYVFIIWDFGSSMIIEDKKNRNYKKLEYNIDLHFFHDLYNRLRVLAVQNEYTVQELELLFETDREKKYVLDKKYECKTRFEPERCEEKFKIALIYYIIENNMFDKVYKNKETDIKLPPDEIMKLLGELSLDNYNYNDVIKMIFNPDYEMPKKMNSPKEYIEKYMGHYKTVKKYDLEFTI